jgi:hypothetical protein
VEVGRVTPLTLATGSQNPDLVGLLLKAGANVNAQDVRGMTPLMLSVASDHADPEVLRLLLTRRPDVNIRSNSGETALAWARKFQYPPIMSQIERASLGEKVPRAPDFEVQLADTHDARSAAAKGLELIQRTTASFFREGGCVSCHAQDATGLVTAVARSKGLPVDEKVALDVLQQTRLEFASRADLFLEREDGPTDIILTTALTGLAFQDVPPDRMTDAMLRNIASQQSPDGYWSLNGTLRPPTADGRISITAMSIRSIRQYAPPGLRQEMNERIEQATKWIVHAKASTTEDMVMQLLGARWGGADAASVERFTRNLIALQREGGGWAQLPQLQPDAYATGTALYALREGGVVSPGDDVYGRGVRFLMQTQAADGSWHVISRAPKIQPYFESGFPYSHDQWISQWATSWSTVALILGMPEKVARR